MGGAYHRLADARSSRRPNCLGVSTQVMSNVSDISLLVGIEVGLGSTTTCVCDKAGNGPFSSVTQTAANDDFFEGMLNPVGTAGGQKGTTGFTDCAVDVPFLAPMPSVFAIAIHHPRRDRIQSKSHSKLSYGPPMSSQHCCPPPWKSPRCFSPSH